MLAFTSTRLNRLLKDLCVEEKSSACAGVETPASLRIEFSAASEACTLLRVLRQILLCIETGKLSANCETDFVPRISIEFKGLQEASSLREGKGLDKGLR